MAKILLTNFRLFGRFKFALKMARLGRIIYKFRMGSKGDARAYFIAKIKEINQADYLVKVLLPPTVLPGEVSRISLFN